MYVLYITSMCNFNDDICLGDPWVLVSPSQWLSNRQVPRDSWYQSRHCIETLQPPAETALEPRKAMVLIRVLTVKQVEMDANKNGTGCKFGLFGLFFCVLLDDMLRKR